MRTAKAFGYGLIGLIILIPVSAFTQQDPPLPPCCLDIYLTGYNLGVAVTLAREGAANDLATWSGTNRLSTNHRGNFLRFMDTACKYLERAHSDCSRVNPAWVDWEMRQDELRRLVEDIQKYGGKAQFQKASGYLTAARNSYAEALMTQIVANDYIHTATCEEKYFKIGFDIAEAQGCLILAGDVSLSEDNRIYLNNLSNAAIQRARDDLNILPRIEPKGCCAPLWEVLSRLTDWQVAYAQIDRTAQNAQLLKGVNGEIQDILSDCVSALGRGSGGGGGGGITPPVLPPGGQHPLAASIVGIWKLKSSLAVEDYPGMEIKLTNIVGKYGYLIEAPNEEFAFWNIDQNRRFYIKNRSDSFVAILTAADNNTWVGIYTNGDGSPDEYYKSVKVTLWR